MALNYSAGGFDPKTVADFVNDYYRVNNVDSNFESMFTHTRSTNATMVDNDGLLKWAPHNLKTNSEDLSSYNQAPNPNTLTPGQADPFGGTNATLITEDTDNNVHRIYQQVSVSSTRKYSLSVFVKPDGRNYVTLSLTEVDGFWAYFDIVNGTLTDSGIEGLGQFISGNVQDFGNGWYRITITGIVGRTLPNVMLSLSNRATRDGGTTYFSSPQPTYTGDGVSGVYVFGIHLVDATLQTANNPEYSSPYVPTTTTARYLPRRGHHEYDTGTSSWVNKGLLLETQQRINYFDHSTNLVSGAYTRNRLSTVSDTTLGPDGSADLVAKVLPENNTNPKYIFWGEGGSLGAGVASVWVKDAGVRYIRLQLYNTLVDVDLLDGSIFNENTATTGGSVGVIPYENGWYRVWCADPNYKSSFYLRFYDDTSYTNPVGDGTRGTLIYGIQIEFGTHPTSYIPAFGADTTRGAETLNIAAANLPSTFTRSQHIRGNTFVPSSVTTNYLTFRGVLPQPYINAYISGSTGYPIVFYANNTEDNDAVNVTTAYTRDDYINYDLAFRAGSAALQLAKDGTSGTSITPAYNVSNGTYNQEFYTSDGSASVNGTISAFREWDVDIGQTGIQEASNDQNFEVSGALLLEPTFYVDVDTFYDHSFAVGAVNLTATLYTDADNFFAPTLSAGAVIITSNLYSDVDTFYNHSFAVGSVALSATLYTDADVFFDASYSVGSVSRSVALYQDVDIFFDSTYTTGAISRVATLYADPDVIYTPTVQTGTLTLVTTEFLESDTIFADANFSAGPVSILSNLYTDPDVIYDAELLGGNNLSVNFYADSDLIFEASYTIGSVTRTSTFYTDVEVFYASAFDSNISVITTEFLESDVIFADATLSPGPVGLTTEFYADLDNIYSPVLSGGNLLIPSFYADTDTVNNSTFAPGPVSRSAEIYTDLDVFYAVNVSSVFNIDVERYVDLDVFYTQLFSSSVSIFAAKFLESDTFYNSSAIGFNTLSTTQYLDADVFFDSSLSVGPYDIQASYYIDSDTFYFTRLRYPRTSTIILIS